MAEYDAGQWEGVRTAAAWLGAADLASFLVGSSTASRLRLIGGHALLVGDDEYARWRIAAVQEIVAGAAGTADTLVELGCGFGQNLFSLALSHSWSRLTGLDVSTNAIEAGTAIATRFGLKHVAFDTIDLAQPSHPGFGTLAGETVLTYFSLEQLPLDVERVVESIVAARPRRVVHVESAVGLLDRRRPLDLLNELYVRSRDYQLELVPVLDRLAETDRIRILARQRLGFGPTIHNEAALMVWEPTVPSP